MDDFMTKANDVFPTQTQIENLNSSAEWLECATCPCNKQTLCKCHTRGQEPRPHKEFTTASNIHLISNTFHGIFDNMIQFIELIIYGMLCGLLGSGQTFLLYSSFHFGRHFPSRRNSFNFENDLTTIVAASEDSDHFPQRLAASGGQHTVANAVST